MTLLDLFFPKKCIECRRFGDYLCDRCFLKISYDINHICVVCNKNSITGLTHPGCKTKYSLDGAFCAVSYKQIINHLLFQFKYEPYLSDLAPTLSRIMYEALLEHPIAGKLLYEKNVVLVPIPLTQRKKRQRGYNQSELLAKQLSKLSGIPVSNLLLRTKETKPQFGLSREDRKKNISDAFGFSLSVILILQVAHNAKNLSQEDPSAMPQDDRKRLGMTDKTVLLIDDVLTTGSTLSEAAKVLKKQGYSRVYGLCMAREQNGE